MTEKNKLKLILKKILSNSPFLYKFFQNFIEIINMELILHLLT